VVSILVNKGANANISDIINGKTPAFVAAEHGHADIIKILAEVPGVNVLIAKADGETPAQIAAKNGHAKVVALLVSFGANVNQTNEDGETLAHIAAKNGHARVISALADKGANLDIEDNQFQSPLSIATYNEENYNANVIVELLLNGADFEDESCGGWEDGNGWTVDENTPLLIATDWAITEKNLPMATHFLELVKSLSLTQGYSGEKTEISKCWGDYIANVQFCNMTKSKLRDTENLSWLGVPIDAKCKILSFAYGDSEQFPKSKEITAQYQQTIAKAIQAKREGGEEAFNRLEWSPRTKIKVF
jgi:hypothetical protein